MWHVVLALREVFAFTTASFRSRLVAATIRLWRIKELRWGSPDVVRRVVDNVTPVKPPPALHQDARIQISQSELSASLVNCPVYEISPSSGIPRGTIVYFHGGAYIHQPGDKQWAAAQRLAVEYECKVVFPIYPKGPKYTFKDAFPPLVELLERTARNGKYLLMGDSAGGGLCIALVLALRDAGKPDAMPTELVLSSPWTDLKLDNPALVQQNDLDPWLNLEGLKEASNMWTGYQSSELVNPLVSPVYGTFTAGIPKISMSIGTRELLYPDQLRFWEKLEKESESKSCGELIIGQHMVHVYAIAGDMPETVAPWKSIDAAVKRLLTAR